ncbi:hypothetical protein NDU88_007624 [Pleurodeles waltl]|uniref:Uncharacterized protein n=1 Tax=Pleurodeles waltl TaxID=8319 RepID=A0AAV7QSF7_PLEWA|nr:hypothetical protein NDU88_007624 [Pleurodeles waltl]
MSLALRRSSIAKSGSVVPDLACSEIFTASRLCISWQAVRKIFAALGFQLQERSVFGPETSGNRGQALSKPLESTSAAEQESSKTAGQQQGSSPLQKAVR